MNAPGAATCDEKPTTSGSARSTVARSRASCAALVYKDTGARPGGDVLERALEEPELGFAVHPA